ncbi:lysosome-associated membrane glycoprotein 2 isoform X1 [Erpetoichthys calabaricus]|uniref:lysosome-associated membrane glycoprotein 2 isoform X1 n=1 Tax=Erpetoichthys calabaricus TaxID=27687 RepID=UPI002234AB5C|nr:lysosome-associated membrane glycoprotein 2 isoform X1 [Erpetoichthys calabaricus]
MKSGAIVVVCAVLAAVSVLAVEENEDFFPHFTKETPMKPALEYTTSHPPHVTNHTTAPHVTNHTTAHVTNQTTAHVTNHTTAPVTNHTTAPVTNHTTAPVTNHTTAHVTNHTTAHVTNHTTAHVTNHTTAHVTNHTTAPVTNHTTAPTVKPPGPTPPGTMKAGDYNVTTGRGNELCVRAIFEAVIKNEGQKQTNTFIIQPDQTNFTGSCDAMTAKLNLTFTQGNLRFVFTKNTTSNTVFVSSIEGQLKYSFDKDTAVDRSFSNDSLRLLEMKIGTAFVCNKQSVPLGNNLYLELSKEHVQAFNITNGNFGPDDICPADKGNYNIAIAVGVVLLILIIIVIVCYIISRRRSQSGYQAL